MFFHFFFSCNGDRAAQNVLPGHGNVLTSGAASPECSRGKSVQLLDRHRLSQVAEHDAAEVYVAVVAHPVSVERELGERAVPVEKAIPSEQKSVDLEHLSHWLDKYDGKYAVGACSCRRSRRVRDEGRGHLEGDMCIAVGDMATYAIETNKARPATREEVMEILQRAAVSAPRCARRAPPSSGRSCVRRRGRSSIRSRCCRMRPNGARKCGTKITETTIRPSTAMTPAPPPARATARRILPSRAISAWLPKAATWTRSSLSKKRTPSPPSAATSATAAASRPAPASALTAPLPSTRSRNSSRSRSSTPTSAMCRRCSTSVISRSRRRSPSSVPTRPAWPVPIIWPKMATP